MPRERFDGSAMRRGVFKPFLVGALAVASVAGLVSRFGTAPLGAHQDASVGTTAGRSSASAKPSTRETSDRRIASATVAPTKRSRAADVDEEIEMPGGSYGEVMPGLRTAAHARNARAAYVLSRMLIDCFLVGRGQPSGFGSSNADRCNQVTVTDTHEAVQLLGQAADAGLVQAQLLYPDAVADLMTPTDMIRDPDAVKQYKERSMAYLASAARQGSAQALLQTASAYANGVMAERNLPMAYAYRYAVNQAFPELGGDDPVLLYGGGLTDDQLSAAKRMGNTIFHQCCR